ncbi:MAG: indoleacetamide hydrolase [Pseudomonadales bacterium]
MRVLAFSLFIILAACNSKTVEVESAASATANKKHEQGDVALQVSNALKMADEFKHLNAFITVDAQGAYESALALDSQQQKGSLHGMLLAVKDNIHVAGLPNTAGTPALKGFIPDTDNEVIKRLKNAGAIVLGKANMHELAFGITSENAAFGAVRNPSDQNKFAGGSSGGTAAAIAAGLVDAGLGTDTGGSVRIPAALTGITGFRPSSGRYPNGDVTPVSSTRDIIGPIATSVTDLIRLDSAITLDKTAVNAADLSAIRLGVDRDYYFSNLDPEVEQCANEALILLAQAGVTIVPMAVPQLSELLAKSGFPIALYEAVHELPIYLKEFDTGVSFTELVAQIASPDVQGVFAAATTNETAIPEGVYQAALQAKQELTDNFAAYFDQHSLDAMVFPTTKLPARNIEDSAETVTLNGEQVPTFPSYIHNTDPATIAKLPAISLPLSKCPKSMPIGLELDGPYGSDRTLLGIALAAEQILSN